MPYGKKYNRGVRNELHDQKKRNKEEECSGIKKKQEKIENEITVKMYRKQKSESKRHVGRKTCGEI